MSRSSRSAVPTPRGDPKAVAAQPPSAPQSSGDVNLTPEQLEQFAPIVRLLAAISAIPQVSHISVTAITGSIDLWVFMPEEDYEAEGRISLAERDYLNSGRAHGFMRHVIPGDDVAPNHRPGSTRRAMKHCHERSVGNDAGASPRVPCACRDEGRTIVAREAAEEPENSLN